MHIQYIIYTLVRLTAKMRWLCYTVQKRRYYLLYCCCWCFSLLSFFFITIFHCSVIKTFRLLKRPKIYCFDIYCAISAWQRDKTIFFHMHIFIYHNNAYWTYRTWWMYVRTGIYAHTDVLLKYSRYMNNFMAALNKKNNFFFASPARIHICASLAK